MSAALVAKSLIHVVLSLVGILSGFAVVLVLLAARNLDGWTALFLASTVLTSVTGFLFPFQGFTPAQGVGTISLIVLAVAIFARYGRHLSGAWRRSYVITSVIALYLEVFVLIVQLFEKVPHLKALAPTKSEPPFMITQLIVLALFVVLAITASIRFRDAQVRSA